MSVEIDKMQVNMRARGSQTPASSETGTLPTNEDELRALIERVVCDVLHRELANYLGT